MHWLKWITLAILFNLVMATIIVGSMKWIGAI